MNDTTVPDQLSRDEVYTSILHGLIANLPAPKGIAFRGDSVSIDLDSIAELHLWRDWFGMQDREVRNQPHPSLSNPADMAIWLASTWTRWRGWHLALAADDLITAEQRDGWVSSGKAAEFAEHEAKKAGLTYSREQDEADDPTPVSPARGGQPHVVAMTNGGLVDETPRELATVYFSFGHGQTDPITGEHLLDKYVTVIGPSYDACREAMFASKYGERWAFDYLPDTPQADEWIPQWTEHERIVLPVSEPR